MRIARDGFVFVRVEFLQLLHRLEAHRGSRVVEAEHVRADVHEHGAHNRMAFRDFREEPGEQGLHDAGENLHGTGLFTDFQDAEPERENAREAEGDFERGLRHVERAEDGLIENSRVAEGEPLDHARDKRAKEEYEPDYV